MRDGYYIPNEYKMFANQVTVHLVVWSISFREYHLKWLRNTRNWN